MNTSSFLQSNPSFEKFSKAFSGPFAREKRHISVEKLGREARDVPNMPRFELEAISEDEESDL
eukprot:CAMPEP_0184711744 /NCGR_PEP_ID=MMETSP0314-20130426/2400_1 /TAXON_ID=38298 /ORGANISM="Rhodella maculata, Strain CCMP 736" /LENGTH=62 /DNA_ID=CAMNT_0027173991 /DNA_START=32 /DNA_END=220 /DNA_ORIENTATION=+